MKPKHKRVEAKTPKRRVSERARVERMLGHKLLKGEIPVVPPSQLPRCPVPATHVKDFEQTCADYAAGRISEADVIARVNESLKSLKQPKPEEPKKSDVPTGETHQ